MQYAAHLPTLPSTRKMVAPVIALVVGAAAATGAYAVIDNGSSVEPGKTIVVERPAPGSSQIPGKDEAATAAAISPKSPPVTQIPGKDEAATAAGISSSSGSLDLRSKAGTSSLAGTSSGSASEGSPTLPPPPGHH
jgi:hypothetical protein